MASFIFVIQLTTAAVLRCLTTSGLPPIGEGRAGALLLSAICKDLQAMGVRAVLLEVDPENEVALALYSRFGFTKTGTALFVKGFTQR
jgi:predicted GNAT superfamily acetyltransferase